GAGGVVGGRGRGGDAGATPRGYRTSPGTQSSRVYRMFTVNIFYPIQSHSRQYCRIKENRLLKKGPRQRGTIRIIVC
ncbi:MAG: hypothetical protein U9N73_00225, partial [Candidatus Auribacterota bacterium]|nr:hypothetical protein [Candidatus Auribacterota bacterium]